jgi:glycine cleavage system H protein
MGNWKTPADLKYARSDEWVRVEGDTATLGISDYAQDQLNDIVFVELPAIGTAVKKGATFTTVESVKAASDIISPVSGTIAEVNTALQDQPELINSDPFGKGWIVKIKVSDASGVNDLMDSAAYTTYCDGREH